MHVYVKMFVLHVSFAMPKIEGGGLEEISPQKVRQEPSFFSFVGLIPSPP